MLSKEWGTDCSSDSMKGRVIAVALTNTYGVVQRQEPEFRGVKEPFSDLLLSITLLLQLWSL
jgi:hypothetical protein